METEDKIYEKIKKHHDGNDRAIPLRRDIVSICEGDVEVAVFLTQIIYWTDRGGPKNAGWFYKSGTEWHEEIGFSDHRVKKCRVVLVGLDLIEIKKYIAEGHNTCWYRPKTDNILKALDDFYDNVKQNLQEEGEKRAIALGLIDELIT